MRMGVHVQCVQVFTLRAYRCSFWMRICNLYEFFIANSIRSKEKVRFDDENEGIWKYSIKDLYPLKKHRKIFYLFDYGSSWYFRILRTQDQPKEKEQGIEYPRLIKSIGKNPLQYDPRYDEEWE